MANFGHFDMLEGLSNLNNVKRIVPYFQRASNTKKEDTSGQ